MVQHNFLSHRGYKISDDILLVPLARGDGDPVCVCTRTLSICLERAVLGGGEKGEGQALVGPDTTKTHLTSEPPNAHASQQQAVVRSALVVFKHGSVVFFNVEEALQSRYLHALARHCGEVVPQAHR